MKCVGYVICYGDNFIAKTGTTGYINAGNPTISGEYVSTWLYPQVRFITQAIVFDNKYAANIELEAARKYHHSDDLIIKQLYI